MPQFTGSILPVFINTDKPYVSDDPKKAISPQESPFAVGLGWDINANPGSENGTNNPSGEGQNMFVLSPARSNAPVSGVTLPAGWNKNIGTYESEITKELYHFNYNSQGNHGIYLIDGDSGIWKKAIVDQKLAFTDDQEEFLKNRVSIRIVKDKDGNVIEKHLIWTNGKKWQGWINVVAAIGSNGYDQSLYPYWTLQPPHFDREELLQWPVRPPMIKPLVVTVPNDSDDSGKINRLIDKAFRFAIAYENTDGRTSRLSPYSLPLIVRSEEFLNNPDNLPKKGKLTLPAGSPLTEKIMIYVQRAGSLNTIDPTAVWGDWILYDTINKYTAPPIGSYWTRTNPWSGYSYDATFNTISYIFDNSKVGTIVSQDDANMIQTGMPQLSQALTDVDDAVILCNNRYNYNNFSSTLKDKLSATLKERTVNVCTRPLRSIYLYAYIGQCGSNFLYTSQVGYTNGDDTQVRFGGLRPEDLFASSARVDINESKFFDLDFADKKALVVYLKGTPYFSVGEWYIARSDNSLERIGNIYDFSNDDVLENVSNIFESGSYFVCRFKLTVPAGRYIATLGRHNVESSADYRATSTYIYGIANSRVKSSTPIPTRGSSVTTIKPDAIVSFSKEMEVDCTTTDVDVWGNNADMFYVYCPYNKSISGNGKYRFIEGYFQESTDSSLPVELFPYQMNHSATDDWGKNTDKNGFYWAFTKVHNSDEVDIQFFAKVNCSMTNFTIPTSQNGIGWMKNAVSYLASHNSGTVGGCNRIVYTGKITDLSGAIAYSNIAISIKDGATVYTRIDGTFTMIVHNGQSTPRLSNVYVNPGGDFLMTIASCGQLPITVFNENLAPCSNCQTRTYPVPLNLQVVIQSSTELSLKQSGKYSIGWVGADLAGRVTSVNVVKEIEVSSYLQRDNVNATYFQALVTAALQMQTENPDIKWMSPYVSKNVVARRYVQWVGDSIEYLDNNGNKVSDPATASLVKVVLDSLYQSNIRNNFSLLSNYQFAKGDRMRVYDDGDGNLFDTATYGDPIDVQVLGTNYNQAAINAGLVPPSTNTVLPSVSTAASDTVGIIMRYDPRLDRLNGKTGFWIEIYTPTQQSDTVPMFECAGFYPIISGEIAVFAGYFSGLPLYTFPSVIDIDFWDTYYLQRIIAGKYFNHPFESANVTDSWGENITSGGRIGVENKSAKQVWLGGDVAPSDSFMKNGFINGLGMFRSDARKNYGIYPFGEIVAAHTKRNLVAFNCLTDWFTVDYNVPYTRVGKDSNLVVTNIDGKLSEPHQKTGGIFGLEKRDIGSLVIGSDLFTWYDRKNSAYSKSNYGNAIDISQQSDSEQGGIQSYLNEKTFAINRWDNANDRSRSFDVIGGIDEERGNIYLTFRPRRGNSNNENSYVTSRRNMDLLNQETFIYSIQYRGWIPCANFTPESYGRLRGSDANVEFYSFAGGKPYYHNNTHNDSFNNYYGVQCEPSFIGVFNTKPENVKILQAISQVINGSSMFVDQVYDSQQNCFSYIPKSKWMSKEKSLYAEALRNMVTYPEIDTTQDFRSFLFDGKRLFGSYFVCRFVQDFDQLGKYFQLAGINYLYAQSFTTKP